MTLTRHFYRVDEVAATLRQCCLCGDARQAAFWLQELLDSEEITVAVATLVETYMVYYGTQHLEWLLFAEEELGGEEVGDGALFAATFALCSYKERDTSLVGLHILRMQDAEPPDYPTSTKSIIDLEGYFAACLRQGKVRAAFWAAGNLDEPAIGRGIEAIMTDDKRRLFATLKRLRLWSGIDFAYHTLLAYTLMVMGRRDIHLGTVKRTSPAWLKEEREKWSAELGRRGRRLYAPHWRRGPLTEIRQLGLQPETVALLGAAPWTNDEVHAKMTDDEWEAWTEKVFVDDIPDEWSAADVAKSHGPGGVAPAPLDFSCGYYTYGMKEGCEAQNVWWKYLADMWNGAKAWNGDLRGRRVIYEVESASSSSSSSSASASSSSPTRKA